jgi:hypothetical protein
MANRPFIRCRTCHRQTYIGNANRRPCPHCGSTDVLFGFTSAPDMPRAFIAGSIPAAEAKAIIRNSVAPGVAERLLVAMPAKADTPHVVSIGDLYQFTDPAPVPAERAKPDPLIPKCVTDAVGTPCPWCAAPMLGDLSIAPSLDASHRHSVMHIACAKECLRRRLDFFHTRGTAIGDAVELLGEIAQRLAAGQGLAFAPDSAASASLIAVAARARGKMR